MSSQGKSSKPADKKKKKKTTTTTTSKPSKPGRSLLSMLKSGGRKKSDKLSPQKFQQDFLQDMKDVLDGKVATRTFRHGKLVKKDGHEFWYSDENKPAKQIHGIKAHQVIHFCRWFFDNKFPDNTFVEKWEQTFKSRITVTRHLCGFNSEHSQFLCTDKDHLKFGSTAENEADKAWHYFGFHEDEQVRKDFQAFVEKNPTLAKVKGDHIVFTENKPPTDEEEEESSSSSVEMPPKKKRRLTYSSPSESSSVEIPSVSSEDDDDE